LNSDALSELFAEWGITLLDIAKKYTPVRENKDSGLSVYTKDDLLKMSNELINRVILLEERMNVSKGINTILDYVMNDTIYQKGGGGVGPNGKTSTNQESKGGESESKENQYEFMDPVTRLLLVQYKEQIDKIEANAKSLAEELKSLTDVKAVKIKHDEIFLCSVELVALQQQIEIIKKGECKLQPAELEAMGNSSSSSNSCVSVLHRATASVASSYPGQVCNAITLPNPSSPPTTFPRIRMLAEYSSYIAVGILGMKIFVPAGCNSEDIDLIARYASITSGCSYLMLIAHRLYDGDMPKDVVGLLGNANVHGLVGSTIERMNGSLIPAINLGNLSLKIPFISNIVSVPWTTLLNVTRGMRTYMGYVESAVTAMSEGPQPWNNTYNSNNNNNRKKKRKTRKYRTRH